MFNSIELQNFKAFGDRTLIELAPITLIFGQNSAGKSSILQALSLLKQTRESREAGVPLLSRAEITDLGSFQEMLFDHDPSRTLSIGLHIGSTNGYSYLLDQWLGGLRPESIGLSLEFRRPEPEGEVQVSGFSIKLPLLDEPLASFTSRDLNESERNLVDRYYWHPSRGRQGMQQSKLRAAVCNHLSDSISLWEGIHRKWSEHRDSIRGALESLRRENTSGGTPFLPIEESESSEDSRAAIERWNYSLSEALEFYSAPFDRAQFVQRMVSVSRAAVVGMDGFVPAPLHRHGGTAPELVALNHGKNEKRIPCIDIAGVAPFVGHLVEDALTSLFPMGPYRRSPERWYIFTGTTPEDVGYRGDFLPDLLFRRPELVEKANQWLDRLDIGYALRVRRIGQWGSDLFEMRLVDRRREEEVDVALSDVGFGISQILPFIVQTLASSRQVISIEQPEVHLHPKLQADLGNLLMTAIREPYEHQFLVETHSEHLILRLQRLVREGKLGPDDISVVFVSRGAGGSSARRLRLDSEGRFLDEWPGGFFAERLRELT